MLVANYLRLVNLTSPLVFDPEDPYAKYMHLAPVIFTMWHGQHFMLPFASIFDFDLRVLISRHHDGEINARVAKKLGVGTVRGSTARDPSRMLEKGGMVGFLEMKAALRGNACVSMTADISNLAPRRAGLGIVALAKASGRVIVPVAYATSRRVDVTAGIVRRSICPSAAPPAPSPNRSACRPTPTRRSSKRNGARSKARSTRRRRAPTTSWTGSMADAPRRASLSAPIA